MASQSTGPRRLSRCTGSRCEVSALCLADCPRAPEDTQAMRRAAKVDTTQRDIVDGLIAAGAQVFIIGQPCDLLVRYYSNRHREWMWQTLECKTPYGKKSPKAK